MVKLFYEHGSIYPIINRFIRKGVTSLGISSEATIAAFIISTSDMSASRRSYSISNNSYSVIGT